VPLTLYKLVGLTMKDGADFWLEKNAFLRESILLIVRTVFFGVLTLEMGLDLRH